MSRSLLASLRVVDGVLRISGATLVDAALGRVTREQTEQRLSWWSRRVVEATGIDLQVEGREHLDGGPFVIMSNHQSHLDVPCLFRGLTSSMRMVAKKELFRIPVFGQAMHQTGFIEVDRQDRGRAIESLNSGKSLLESGLHLWIAPEGTRSVSGELQPFKKGGFMVALATGAPILPVGLHGTRNALPVHAVRAQIGQRVGIVVGKPIATGQKDRDALMAETRAAIEALVVRARQIAGA